MLHVLTVVCGAPTQGFLDLKRSAEKVGLSITVLGARAWAGGVTKFHECSDFVMHLPAEDIVVFTDAYDSLFAQGEAALLSKFAAFGAEFVMSAERNCHPFPERAADYPACDTPYRYLNSGGWIGTAAAVRRIFERLRVWRLPGALCDQGVMTDLFLSGTEIVMDSQCSIFQTLYMARDDLQQQGNEIVNLVTGQEPVIFHGNGGSDLSQVREWIGIDRS